VAATLRLQVVWTALLTSFAWGLFGPPPLGVAADQQ
jgi:hypothetical protein